uniref:Uncharacterized protein n=1 Tax=Opuntia streptacantha TaxID=393608 RepID=A0A7C9EPT3_OPUST
MLDILSYSNFNSAFSCCSFRRDCFLSSSPEGGPPQEGHITLFSASRIAIFSHRNLLFSKRRELLSARSFCAFIWVLLFWNQNFICLGSRPSSAPSWRRWFSSGCGHSLKNSSSRCVCSGVCLW